MTALRALTLLGVLACSACATRPPAVETPSAPPAASDLSGARDRERLAALVAARRRVPASAGYRIGADDLLEIRIPDLLGAAGGPVTGDEGSGPAVVGGVPSFQQGLRVSAGGDVVIPMLGPVRAAGLTASELEQDVARRLVAAGILVAPQVSVLIAEYRSRVVAVVGSVERPGLYPVSRPSATVADLIWTAGGPSREAGRVVAFSPTLGDASARAPVARALPSAGGAEDAAAAPAGAPVTVRDVRVAAGPDGRRVDVVLSRAPAGVREFLLAEPARLVIDVDDPQAEGATRHFALGDDVVTGARAGVDTGRLRVVLDLSREPGGYSLERRDNVLSVRLGGDDVPAGASEGRAAGGACGGGRCAVPAPSTPEAIAEPIRIDLDALLQAGGARGLDPEVRAGDVISIAPAGSVQVHGWVAKPGSYPITRGLTVGGAVAAAGGSLFPADLRIVTVNRVLGPRDRRTFTVDLAAVEEGAADDVSVLDGDVVRLPTRTARLVPWGLWALVREVVRIGGNVVLF